MRPDVVLLYGVSAESTALTAKLRELHLPYLYLGDYTEQSPLGKAEWLVAVAEIMGKSSGTFSAVDGSVLHKALPLLQPAHG